MGLEILAINFVIEPCSYKNSFASALKCKEYCEFSRGELLEKRSRIAFFVSQRRISRDIITPKWVKDNVRWLAEKLSNWPSNSVTKPGIAGYLLGKKPF